MLMVLEIAPEMNGWAAAIMRMWLAVERKRLPRLPQRLAQSKTGRCSALQVRRALDGHRAAAEDVGGLVSAARVKPSARQQVEARGRPSCASLRPSTSRQKSSPSVQRLKANVRSNALGSAPRAARRISSREALGGERLVVDVGRADQRAAADRVAHDVVDLLAARSRAWRSAGGTIWLMILK